jgi:hypothetical protein
LFEWFSPFVVVDQDANVIYYAAAKSLFATAARFGLRPVRGITTTVFTKTSSFHPILEDFRRTSRDRLFSYIVVTSGTTNASSHE